VSVKLPTFSRESARPDKAMSKPGQPPIGAPILVVEDDQTTCDVIRAYLESAGHRVVICRSGSEALGFVRQTEPRCLILDVMLPGKDGFEICAEIRDGGSIIPILFSVRAPTSQTGWTGCARALTTIS
jgi:DNA-binding response OmpR family regulator